MSIENVDIAVVGAGPVGLMCAYLGKLCGLKTLIIDKSEGPLEVGRADALNARTLQLLEVVKLFGDLYPLGKPCNTSSVWANGQFLSRQSFWWEELEGCLHKHFLMLGQAFVEKLLDKKLYELGAKVKRKTSIETLALNKEGVSISLSSGEKIQTQFLIGADGSRSFIRNHFKIPFQIIRPQITWAVIDGVINTDFPKVPEIIVFQSETADVAWIPREGKIDRFYIRMDKQEFSFEECIEKINIAIHPHTLSFQDVVWFSQFSVKESVAEKYFVENRVFLAGDSCHIHSVNGGQGLNTGLADAFNLIWKLNMFIKYGSSNQLLESYESERKPVAQSVIETSGELVRSTKFSNKGTHAQDYVGIVEKRAGNITGMGIRYNKKGISGTRLFDFEVYNGKDKTRLYSLLDYSKFSILIFGNLNEKIKIPDFIQLIQIDNNSENGKIWTSDTTYNGKAILVRPDAYIHEMVPIEEVHFLIKENPWDFKEEFS